MAACLESTVSLPRGELQYVRFGTGSKKMVMIAGMSMAGLSGLGEAIAEEYHVFTEEYTVFVFDRLTVMPEDYSVRQMAEDTAAAMKLLGITQADVTGASQGGMIALYLAIDHPELVHSLALTATSGRQNEIGKETFRTWMALAEKKDGRGIYRDYFKRVFTSFSPDDLAAVEHTGTDAQCRRFGILLRSRGFRMFRLCRGFALLRQVGHQITDLFLGRRTRVHDSAHASAAEH